MVRAEAKGLTRAREIYQNRDQRVKELKAAGKTVMGYLCIYPVLEMMTALDLVPYRMFGDMSEPITDADNYLPTMVCPFLRSLLDLGLKGKYDFLDGVVMAHICDVGARVSHLWDVGIKTPYSYFIDVPHTNRDVSQERFKELLADFQKSLESFTGKELTASEAQGSHRGAQQAAGAGAGLVRPEKTRPAPDLGNRNPPGNDGFDEHSRRRREPAGKRGHKRGQGTQKRSRRRSHTGCLSGVPVIDSTSSDRDDREP